MRSSQEAYPQLTHERLNPMGSAKSFPVWTARCGQKVKVLLVLTEEETDIADTGPMCNIMFEDGTETSAFEDELTPCD